MNQLNRQLGFFFLLSLLCFISCIRSPDYPPIEFGTSVSKPALIFSGLPASGIAGMGLSSELVVLLEGFDSADSSVKEKSSDAVTGIVKISLYSDNLCTIPASLAPNGSPSLIGYTPVPLVNGRTQLSHLAITKAQPLYIQARYQGISSSCTPITILPGQSAPDYAKLTFSSNIFNIGEPVTLTYTAYDAYGNKNPSGISAETLAFSLITGGGVFTSTMSLGNGVFTSTFTSTVPGQVVVTATNSNVPDLASPAVVQAVSGVPYSISMGGGNNQSGAAGSTASTPLSVIVWDVSSRPVYGDVVVWSIVTGGGSFSSPTSTTNASGIGQVLYTYSTVPGQNTILATASSGGLLVYFTETSVPGPVDLAESSITVTFSTITAGGSLLATLNALDAYGNPSPSGIVSASLTKIAGTGSGTFTQLGGSNGVYTATFGGITAGTISIGGLINGSSTGSPVAVVTILPGPVVLASSTLTVSSSTVSAGSIITATMTAYDAYGNTNPSGITSGSFALTTGTGNGTLTQTGSTGGIYTATFSGVLVGTVTIGGFINGSSVATPIVITIVPGPAASLIMQTCPTSVTAGNVTSINVIAQDSEGNTATGYTGTVAMSSNDAKAVRSPISQTATTGGTLGFSVTLETATTGGGATFTARDSVHNLTVTCVGITVYPGPVVIADTTLTVSSSSVPAGNFITATMTPYDAYGNTNPSGITSAILTLATGTGSGTLTQTGSTGGIYTATFGGTLVGTVSIGGTINGISTGIPVDIVTVVSGTANSLVIQTCPTLVTAGNVQDIDVIAKDIIGNTATSYTGTVSLSSNDVQAVFSPSASQTATTGGTLNFAVTLETANSGGATFTAQDSVHSLTATCSGITVLPGPVVLAASTLTVSNFLVQLGDSVTATLTAHDLYGNTNPSGVINGGFTLITGTGSGTITTLGGVNGVYTATFGGTGLGNVTIGGLINGSPAGIPVELVTIVVPGTATLLEIQTCPTLVTAGYAQNIDVVALSSVNNPAVSYGGTITLSSNDPLAVFSPSNAQTVTTGGTVAFSVTLETATTGGAKFTAVENTYGITTKCSGITVLPAPINLASTTLTVSSSTVSAGSFITATMIAHDAYGNTNPSGITSGGLILTTGTGSGTLTQMSSAGGIYTASFGGTIVGTVTIGGMINGSSVATPIVVTIVPGTAASLIIQTCPTLVTAGSAQSFKVIAQDTNSNTATGYKGSVSLSSNDPLAIFSPSASQTATTGGTLSFAVTLETATAGGATFTAWDSADNFTVTCVGITVVPGNVVLADTTLTVSSYTVSAGNFITATMTTFDAYGNTNPSGITSAILTLVTGTGNGVLTQVSSSGGVYIATFGGITAGTVSIGGSINGSSVGIPVDVITIIPGPVVLADTTLTVSSSTVSAGSFVTAIMTAYDAYGNTNPSGITSGGLILTTGTGSGTLTQVSSSGGVYTATFGGILVGTVSIGGLINGSSIGIPVDVVTVVPGAATSLVLQTCPTTMTAGSAQSINVIAKDIDNNIATGYTGTVVLSSNDPMAVFSPSVSQTATTGGTLNFSVTLETATAGGATFTARDSADNLTITCGGITVYPGPINLASTTLTVSSSTVSAGSFITATMIAHDAYGNTNPSGITSGGLILTTGTGSGTLTQMSSAGGIYTASFGGTIVGTVTIGGMINGSSVATPIVVTIVPGAAASLIIQTCPTLVTAGSAQSFNVIAQDTNSNTATGYKGTVSLSSNDAKAVRSPTSQTATTGGTLNFAVTLETATAGGATFTARDSADNFTVTCVGITVVPGNVVLADTTLTVSSYTVSAGNFITATMTTFDAYGNTNPWGITSAILTLATGTGNGVLTQVSSSGGVYTATFGGITAGTVSIGGSINGSSLGIPVDVITIIPGPVVLADTTLTVSSSTVSAGSFVTAIMTAYDAYGNTNPSGITSGSLILTSGTGNGVLTQVSSVGGVYTATFGGVLVGTVSIGGLINGSSTGIPVDVVTVVPGTATSLVLQTCPTTMTAGSAQSINVIAKDIDNNIATGYTGTVALSSNDPMAIFSPSVSQTATTGGTLNFSVTLETAATSSATFTARDSADNLTVTCGGITVYPGPVVIADTTFTVSAYTVSAGSFITATMITHDAYGNTNPSGITSGGLILTTGTGSGTLTQVSSGGVYTATFGGTLVGTVSIGGLINGSSIGIPVDVITIVPGTPTHLTITAPSMVSKGGAFSAVVTAYDAYGNVATQDVSSVTMTSNDGAGVITPTSGAVLTAGTKTFSVTLNTATVGKTAILTATSGGLTATAGGIAVSFVTNVIYNTATQANYSVSSGGAIGFTASSVGLTALSTSFVDNSNAVAGFGGATLNGVAWGTAETNNVPCLLMSTGGLSFISVGGVNAFRGTLTSRIYNWAPSPSTSAGGISLSWKTPVPFGKNTPLQTESSTSYASMTSSYSDYKYTSFSGLWHMDETAGPTLSESSGNSQPMTLLTSTGGSISYGQPSLLHNAVSMTKGYSNGVSCPSAAGVSTTITLGALINIPSNPGVDMSVVSIDTSNLHSAGTAIMEVYYSHVGNSIGCDFNTIVTPAGVSAFVGYTYGSWVQVFCLMYFQNGGKAVFYHNSSGTLVAQNTGGLNMPTPGGPNLYIGKADLPYTGLIDEVFLEANTYLSYQPLWRRTGEQLWFQVRACADATCSASPPFVGPDGTSNSYYSELENTSPQSYPAAASATVLLTGPNMLFSNFATAPQGAYIQYQATFITMDKSTTNPTCNRSDGVGWCSPELQAVTIGGTYYDVGQQDTVTTISGVVTLSSAVAELTGFSDVESCSTGGVLYNLSTNGSTWYYWNGAAWVINPTGTLANANTVSVVNSQISSFTASGSLYIKAFLESNGLTTCTLSSVQVQGYQ